MGAYYFTFFMWPKPLQLPGNYVYPYYNMRSQEGGRLSNGLNGLCCGFVWSEIGFLARQTHCPHVVFVWIIHTEQSLKESLPTRGVSQKREVKECVVFSCLFLSSCESTLEHLQITGACSTNLAVFSNT